jgi:SAM-dependent methyltransferase
MPDFSAKSHWRKVYTEKAAAAVSWYQSVPRQSLLLIDAAAAERDATPEGAFRIIDIGAGASTLVDHLVRRPNTEICAVDIAPEALALARARIAVELAPRIHWLEGDVALPLEGVAPGWADVWHDRAVFHFLTAPPQRLAYAQNLARILKQGGTAIIATFAPDGPERCSGLPVCRHDAESIAAEVCRSGRAFTLIGAAREEHLTPWGSVQPFVYAVLRG